MRTTLPHHRRIMRQNPQTETPPRLWVLITFAASAALSAWCAAVTLLLH